MGKKINPIIFRISSVLRAWDAKWFADRRTTYRRQATVDLIIRRYFEKHLRLASISKIEIARDQHDTVLTLFTSRPAVVIGRGGAGIEKIQKDLRRLTGKGRLRINVQEIRNPDVDAGAIVTQVAEQIERRMPYRRILKQAVSRAMQAGALGVRVAIAGRLNGADIARREWLAEGNVPLHTFRSNVSYARKTAFTTYGTIGVKAWVNRGEFTMDEEKPGETRSAKRTTPTKRQRPSLVQAAQANVQTRKEKK
jgi:small subunit ribosomal protein S3